MLVLRQRALLASTIATGIGCAPGPVPEGGTTEAATGSTGDPGQTSGVTTSPMPTDTTTAPSDPTSGGSTTSPIDDTTGGGTDTCASGCPDTEGEIEDCDVFAQDCPDGEKCMPYASPGSTGWDALRCSPILDDPDPPGATCTVQGGPTSGLDSCDGSSMCFLFNPATNTGECVPFCTGSPVEPECEGGGQCMLANENVLALCLPECDPLEPQACSPGQTCTSNGSGFECFPFLGDPLQYGDPCQFSGECGPGLFCAYANFVPDCAGTGCCTQFCDVSVPDPDAVCLALADGMECIPWYVRGQAPRGLEDVGGCVG